MDMVRHFRNLEKLGGIAALAVALVPVTHGGTFVVPLNQTNGWQFLHYHKIPPNTFRVSSAGLEIGVTNTAAPAVFPLPRPLPVAELRASGTITGTLKVPPGKQGGKGSDDYTVRVGLVEAGSRTLTWREKLVSADWIKRLFALAPRGTGISRIHFFNVGTDPRQIGHTRTHPLSDLLEETVVGVPDANGNFAITKHFSRPMNVLAVWIASDGDDTKSSFVLRLNRVELETSLSPENK